MFIGHFAVAFAAKQAAPRTSLGTLFLASQFLDLLWPLFLLLGLEHVRIDPGNTAVTPLDFHDYPFTHSLVTTMGWSLLVGACLFILRRDVHAALVAAFCVFSHWILDLVTHRPDLPLAPSSQLYFGLGLWNSLWATIVVETGLFAAGVFLYVRQTSSSNKAGSYALWTLIGFLLLIYAANLFGPPPPGEREIAVLGNAAWLLVLWGYWVDRNRQTVERSDKSN